MLQSFFDKLRPHFEEGGKLHAFHSVFEGMETFVLVPNTTAKVGVSIHDAIDSKRIMTFVIIALLPALFFGMYNIGYQTYMTPPAVVGASFWEMFAYGFLIMLPKIVVSYAVGLGIEFAVAQYKHEEINEGYLVTGLLIPMIVPIELPLWMLAVAVAFSVIFAKEIFGGTGMNFFNPALVARAFLFFSYSGNMTGDKIWIAKDTFFGLGNPNLTDAVTMATPLTQASTNQPFSTTFTDMVVGLMPGSIGETSVIAILIGAVILLWTRIASWRTMLSVFVGGGLVAFLFNSLHIQDNAIANIPWYEHLALGGFCFGAVFMATDPVTSARTEKGKFIYGFFIGALAIIIRVLNPGFPGGRMLAVLFMNVWAPFIDYCFVESNIKRRAKRAKSNTL